MTLHEALEGMKAAGDARRRITAQQRAAQVIRADLTGEADRTPTERLEIVKRLQQTMHSVGNGK
jgi:hypothetical protein